MNSNVFTHFAESLGRVIYKESLNITRLFKHVMNDYKDPWRALPEEFSAGMVKEHLFMSVVKEMAGKPESVDVRMNPEETVAQLIRHGIPKESISVTYKYLTASLPNADYRLYRGTGGYPAGTIRITRNGCSVFIRPGLASEETARFVLLLDAHLPEIDEAAEALFEELQRLFREKQTENMALEIARQSVEAQLADVLPGMGITGKFNIADGKVRLILTRTCRAEVELPLESLPDFLSDPERLESTLKIEPVSPAPESSRPFPRPFSPERLFSRITVKP